MIKNKIIWLAMVFLGGFILLGMPSRAYESTIIPKAEEVKDEIEIKDEPKEKDEIDLWIDKLSEFECKGCGENFRIVDVNGKYSYGCMQFQRATFEAVERRYRHTLATTSRSDSPDRIYECKYQKALVREMVLHESEASIRHHWYTTIHIKGLGLPPKE